MSHLICHCGEQIAVQSSMAGVTIKCSQCGVELNVPSLRVLKKYADLGMAVPISELTRPEPEPDENAEAPPDAFILQCCGEVGWNGYVSVHALGSYADVASSLVEDFMTNVAGPTPLELIVSCALGPNDRKLIVIETAPTMADDVMNNLQTAIEEIPAPPIERGPVGLVVYRRVNLPDLQRISLAPFGPYKASISRFGMEATLSQVLGCRFPAPHPSQAPPQGTPQNETMLQRLLQRAKDFFLGRSKRQRPDLREVYNATDRITWIQQNSHKLLTEDLVRLAILYPHDPAHRAALALRHAENEEWEQAMEQYSAALKFASQSSTLHGQLAQVQRAIGSRQASLASLNKAIELTPSEPWFYYQRSEIFADLEAWPQAIADLDIACDLAPREPAILLPRAGIHLMLGSYEKGMRDCLQTLQLDPNSFGAHAHLGQLYQHEQFEDLELALNHLNRSIELGPEEVDPRAQRSMIYCSQNKIELAMQDADAILSTHPETGVGHGLRGRILQIQGEFEEAIEACTEAMERGLETPGVLLTRGIAYAGMGEHELAFADCEAVLEMEPDNPMACQLHGMLNMQAGDLDVAMEALMKARDIAPDWSGPREQLALLHRIRENPQAAVEEQTVLVDQQPSNSAHYVNRAFAYAQLSDFDNAQEDFDRACELDPENEEIYYLRGCFFMNRQQAEPALQDFDRALAIESEHDAARLARASVLLQLKRHTEALDEYGKLIAKHPDDFAAYTGRAYTHQVIGNLDEASADFDRLSEMMPEMSQELEIQSLCGKVARLESEQRYAEAIEAAEQVIHLAPDDPTGYRLRGWILWYDEQHVEAVDDYTQLLEIEPDDWDALNARGQIRAEMGELDDALHDLDAAVDGSRKAGRTELLAFALNGRALALAALGRDEESTRDYEESIQLCPTNAWAYYNRAIVTYQRGNHGVARDLLKTAMESTAPPLTLRKRQRAESLFEQITDSLGSGDE